MRSTQIGTPIAAIALLGCSCMSSTRTDRPRPNDRAVPGAESSARQRSARGAYLGQSAADVPTLFAPGFVSTRANELNAAFSPDGRELYFSITDPGDEVATILVTRQVNGVWSEPSVAPFSGQYSDVDPNFSPDGRRLYFSSTRPLSSEGGAKDADIWYVERTGSGWSEPVNVGPPINTPRNDWYATLTTDGSIYFSTWDPERNTDDIFRARPTVDGYEVENVGEPINTGQAEFDPFIAPDESYLIFASYRRGNMGSSDLFISFNHGGAWSEPRNLGPTVNSAGKDYCPVVSPDGRYFFFTSKRPSAPYASAERKSLADLLDRYDAIENGLGNIYWANREVLGLGASGSAR